MLLLSENLRLDSPALEWAEYPMPDIIARHSLQAEIVILTHTFTKPVPKELAAGIYSQ